VTLEKGPSAFEQIPPSPRLGERLARVNAALTVGTVGYLKLPVFIGREFPQQKYTVGQSRPTGHRHVEVATIAIWLGTHGGSAASRRAGRYVIGRCTISTAVPGGEGVGVVRPVVTPKRRVEFGLSERLGTTPQVPGTTPQVPGTMRQVPGTMRQVPGTTRQVGVSSVL